MSGDAFTIYRIRTTDPADQTEEINRLLGLIATRLDQIEGFRGQPRVYDTMLLTKDIVALDSTRGLILLDQASPPQYWRITIDTTGTLQVTQLGPTYE